MKLSQTRQTIDAYVEALAAAGAEATATALREVARFLDEYSGEEMSTLVQRGSRLGPPPAERCANGELSTAIKVAGNLECLAKVLTTGGAKAEQAKDLGSFSKLLRTSAESGTLSAVLDKLREAMTPEPIDAQIASYIERLKKQTGTAAFDRTLADLASSPLKREHVLAVAMSVYGGVRKSTSRKAAIDYIRKPHDAYMSAKRGIDATGGRSAA